MNAKFAAIPVGVLRVLGRDRIDLLHRLSTNDLRPLTTEGQWRFTVFTTEKGRTVDWVAIYALADALLVQTSAGRAATLRDWIDRFTIMEDVRTQVEDGWQRLLVLGEDAASVVGLTRAPQDVETVSDAWNQPWRRTLLAGGQGVEGLVASAHVQTYADRLLAAGAVRMDATALEVERLLAGIPSPDFEFKDETNPLELRLSSVAISFRKGCYIGQEVISRMDSYSKVARLLMGFAGAGFKEAPEPGAKLTQGGKPVGKVTSAAVDPLENRVLGLALVKNDFAIPQSVELQLPSGAVAIELVDRPMWNA